jgi:hypothetical protein
MSAELIRRFIQATYIEGDRREIDQLIARIEVEAESQRWDEWRYEAQKRRADEQIAGIEALWERVQEKRSYRGFRSCSMLEGVFSTPAVRFHYAPLQDPPDNVRVHIINISTFQGAVNSWRLFDEINEDLAWGEDAEEHVRQAHEVALLLANEVLNDGKLDLIDRLFTKEPFCTLLDLREGGTLSLSDEGEEVGLSGARELLQQLTALRGDGIFRTRLAQNGIHVALRLEPEPAHGWQIDLVLTAPTGRVRHAHACVQQLGNSPVFTIGTEKEREAPGGSVQTVPRVSFCSQCGSAIGEDWRFCMSCGGELPTGASS